MAEKKTLGGHDKKFLMGLLESMHRIRAFEEKAGQMYGLRKIGGFCHLYSGQEAVAVGVVSALDLSADYVLTGYRDHGHALACGMDPKAAMAELYGKSTGCSKGKGGSMHFFDAEKHMLGGNGIVGAQIPVAAGVAFAQAYRGRLSGAGPTGATVCFFGDGAIHQGAFHEAFNLAGIWKLPLVLVVENNQWGMGTSWKRVSSNEDFSAMAGAYAAHGEAVDGMDVLAVHAAASRAVKLAKAEGAPALLEVRTYRYKGHSMSDPQKYRTREEVEAYRARDPILLLEGRMEEAGLLSEKEKETLRAEAEAMAEEAAAFAEASPEPDPSELFTDVYADPEPRDRAASEETWR